MDKIDLSSLKTSWTKYEIVQVLDVVDSIDVLMKFKKKEAKIDEPILKAFLNVSSLDEPLPKYWKEIQDYPREKKLFALLSIIFTHIEVIKLFAEKYSKKNMQGVFKLTSSNKMYTNIRSALVESGASEVSNRRLKVVPYTFATIIHNLEVGKLFKKLLLDRFHNISSKKITDSLFYNTCYEYKFHKALSLSKTQFKLWLEGEIETGYIKKVEIANFFSIKNINLDLENNTKEIYLLGENGDGKSLILMAIYLAFNGNFVLSKTKLGKTGIISDIIRNNKNIELIGFDDFRNEFSLETSNHLEKFYAYGTHRGRYSTDDLEQYGFMSLFDIDQTLINPVSWIKDLQLEHNNNVENFSVQSLNQMFYEILEKNVSIQIDGNKVYFIEKGNRSSFSQLSEGYRSIIIFITDLIYRLSIHKKNGEKITELKASVLVDEIDAHLHPKWQRTIVSKLRKLFPNIQFIFTTHSPSIIQGASEDAMIYRVYRNSDDGKTRVSDPFYRKDIDHLMLNTLITSPLFGLEDSRMNSDDNTADTSDTYLLYRINKKLEDELQKQKNDGKQFIDDDTIDHLIKKVIDAELKNNDKNK